jgi:ATP-dependent Clp protease adaptor protein ClpS
MTTEILTKKKKTVRTKLEFPKKYKVIICNDDTTPIDFVIALLVTIFHHNNSNAYNITMNIHNQGYGIAGIYNYEIAEQKTIEAINLSRYHGWPLIVKVEEN